VEMCKSRFLQANVLDLREFTADRIGADETVIMSETLEHLERPVGVELLGKLLGSTASKIIITVPDNCHGPEEVPEHTALFNDEYLSGMLADAEIDNDAWEVQVDSADEQHLICVITRK